MQSPVKQVIDVPKIPEDSIQQRLVARDSRAPQMAEKLVEVPTVLSFSSLQRSAEQNIDISVPGRGGGGGEGGGAEQIVDIPVGGGLPGFLPRQGSRTANKIADIPAGGGLHGYLPDPGGEEVGHGRQRLMRALVPTRTVMSS